MGWLIPIVGALVLTCAGCAQAPEPAPVPQISYSRLADYQTWACPDLLAEAASLSDAAEVADELQPDAASLERTAYIQRAQEAVHKELVSKHCKSFARSR
jgi:hypothetical protein